MSQGLERIFAIINAFPLYKPCDRCLEQHSRVDLRFSASGRIDAIQFPGRTTQACCDLRLLPVVWQVQNEVSYKMTLSQRATARRDGGLFIRGYVLRLLGEQ